MRRILLGLAFSLIAKAAFATQIILTAGTTWTVPDDWNNVDNTVEVIGAGADGGGPSYNSFYYGGGGGAYAKIVNFSTTKGASITVHFGSIDCAGTTDGTWFNSSATVFAESGYRGCNQNNGVSPGQGGRVAFSIGTTRFAGGSGSQGGGGGGAAGPNGAGVSGGNNGGAGDAGFGGAGGVGGVGGNGTEFDASHGSGGGGGGTGTAFAGGNYGAGGGATPATGAAGTGGLIVITYTPQRRISQGAF